MLNSLDNCSLRRSGIRLECRCWPCDFRLNAARGKTTRARIAAVPIVSRSKRIERASESSQCAYRSSGSSFVFQRHSRARIRVKGAFSYWRAAQHVENPRRRRDADYSHERSAKSQERFEDDYDRPIFAPTIAVGWPEDQDKLIGGIDT